MSDFNRPVRRRRIAGESRPAAPVQPAAQPPAVKRATPKKPATAKLPPVVKKAPAAEPLEVKKAPTVKKAPAAKKAPAVKAPTVKTAPAVDAEATGTSPTVQPVEAPTPKEPRPAGSRPSRRDLLWLVPASLVAIAALVAGVLLVLNPPGKADSSDLDASRRQASAAAGSAAETIFSFRYDQLDQHLKASKAIMTPTFAKEFDKIAPALTELAPQRSIVVQAVTRESAALPCGDECTPDKVDILVFVDQARLIGDSTEPTVFANRIKVSMVKGDDGWLVANVRAL